VLMNRVCMVRTEDERFRECRPTEVAAMFELLEDLLIFQPSLFQVVHATRRSRYECPYSY
jgi:hypothetical protein